MASDPANDAPYRLLREVEKLALDYGPGAQIGVEEVQAASATSSLVKEGFSPRMAPSRA